MKLQNRIITVFLIGLLILSTLIVLIVIKKDTNFPIEYTFDYFLSIISISVNFILTLLIINITMKDSNRANNDNYNLVKKNAFIIKQELCKIFEEFHMILRKPRNKENIEITFYISSEWRTNISTLIPYIPSDVITSIYNLYLFCESANQNSLDFSAYKNLMSMMNFVEVNSIEFVYDKSNAFLISKSEFLFLFDFADAVMSNRVIKKLTEEYTSFFESEESLVNNKTIKKYIYEYISDGIYLKNIFEKYSLIAQTVDINGTRVRDCTYDAKGYSTGLDIYTKNDKLIYSMFYRKNKFHDIVITFPENKTNISYQYVGDTVNGKLHGNGKVLKNGKLIEEGEYIDGVLINGMKYDVEVNRIYKDKKKQKEYNEYRYYNSDEYIEASINAQEDYYKEYEENEYLYIRESVDYRVKERKLEVVNSKEEKIQEYDAEDYI